MTLLKHIYHKNVYIINIKKGERERENERERELSVMSILDFTCEIVVLARAKKCK